MLNFSTVKGVVYSVINRRGEGDLNNYQRYKQFALEGLFEMNIKVATCVDVWRGYANNAGIISLPSHYAKYTKVGLDMGGEIWTLGVNPEMINDRTPHICNSDLDTVSTVSENSESLQFAPHVYRDRYYGAVYGKGGGFNVSYYKEDRKSKRIFINPNITDREIIVEFISTGKQLNDGTIVPVHYIEPLRRWIDKIIAENNVQEPLGARAQKDLLFDHAMREATINSMSWNFDEIIDAVNSATSQTIKR